MSIQPTSTSPTMRSDVYDVRTDEDGNRLVRTKRVYDKSRDLNSPPLKDFWEKKNPDPKPQKTEEKSQPLAPFKPAFS